MRESGLRASGSPASSAWRRVVCLPSRASRFSRGGGADSLPRSSPAPYSGITIASWRQSIRLVALATHGGAFGGHCPAACHRSLKRVLAPIPGGRPQATEHFIERIVQLPRRGVRDRERVPEDLPRPVLDSDREQQPPVPDAGLPHLDPAAGER